MCKFFNVYGRYISGSVKLSCDDEICELNGSSQRIKQDYSNRSFPCFKVPFLYPILFVANQKKPSDIINVLVANRNKLLRLLADLKLDKEDESFEADKAHVVSEIASLKPRDLA
ncbi:unnamed protein product [Brassica oleracea var. botrytis]